MKIYEKGWVDIGKGASYASARSDHWMGLGSMVECSRPENGGIAKQGSNFMTVEPATDKHSLTKSPTSRPQRNWPTFFLLLVIPLMGFGLILYETKIGPGINGDSIQYIMGAENLAAGNGFSRISGGGELRPITGFAPLYSTVLAGLSLVGLDIYQAARILNALLFGANIFLVAQLLFRYTGTPWLALFGSALVLASDTQIQFHIMALTEPTFIFFMLLAIYGLTQYLDTNNPFMLLLSAVAVSLGSLTRYVGVSMTATGLILIFFLSKNSWKRRILDCIIFGGVSLLPAFLWLRRTTSDNGTLANRIISFHPMSTTIARVYVAEVASWFVPRVLGLPRPIRNVLVALLALPWPALFFFREGKAFFGKKDVQHRPLWSLPWALVLNSVILIIVLVVNTSLLDAGTPVSAPPRYLTPVFVSTVILFVIVLFRLSQRIERQTIIRFVPLAYGVLLVILYAITSMPMVRNPMTAIGYLGYIEQRQDAQQELQSLDPEVPIISNNPEMLYAFIHRSAYMWPIEFDHYVQQDREDFDQQVAAVRERLEQGGVLVVFGWPVGAETLVFDILGAERLSSFIDITLFGYPEAIGNE
jgi:hypothetical protein